VAAAVVLSLIGCSGFTRVSPTPTSIVPPTAAPSPSFSWTPATGTRVPASIDPTGAKDVSAALGAFIDQTADGSTVVFPAGSVYRLASFGIRLAGRHDLTFEGSGSTLLVRTPGNHDDSAAFWLSNLATDYTSGIIIRGFTIDGGNANTGTTSEYEGHEGASGIWTGRGTHDVEVYGVTFRNLYGHGVTLTDDSTGLWTDSVQIHDNHFLGVGTMGIALLGASNVVIEHNVITDVGWSAIDIEPEHDSEGVADILIRSNDFIRYGWHDTSSNWWLSMVPDDGGLAARMDRITVELNSVHAGAATSNNGNYDGIGGLAIRADKTNPKTAIAIRGNWTSDSDTQDASQSVMSFANVNGLTVDGNTQPIANGSALVACSGGTGVITSANATSMSSPGTPASGAP